ncbi:hypothetical protein SDC9_162520 [bioreactor metagenome]|uniref:Uncharacterized protein n=1 Tax=bioreactor metagenome TaxID=1076179 RepID=A0A645FLB6_9ZZZZ
MGHFADHGVMEAAVIDEDKHVIFFQGWLGIAGLQQGLVGRAEVPPDILVGRVSILNGIVDAFIDDVHVCPGNAAGCRGVICYYVAVQLMGCQVQVPAADEQPPAFRAVQEGQAIPDIFQQAVEFVLEDVAHHLFERYFVCHAMPPNTTGVGIV